MNDKPTPSQIRYVAILSAKLGLPEPRMHSRGEAGRMIRELEEEQRQRSRARSDLTAKVVYNVLAEHGEGLYYDIITSIIKKERPGLGITDQKVLSTLSRKTDLFRKISPGVYFLVGKLEGQRYPKI